MASYSPYIPTPGSCPHKPVVVPPTPPLSLELMTIKHVEAAKVWSDTIIARCQNPRVPDSKRCGSKCGLKAYDYWVYTKQAFEWKQNKEAGVESPMSVEETLFWEVRQGITPHCQWMSRRANANRQGHSTQLSTVLFNNGTAAHLPPNNLPYLETTHDVARLSERELSGFEKGYGLDVALINTEGVPTKSLEARKERLLNGFYRVM